MTPPPSFRSYLASVLRMSSEGPGRATHRPRRGGETSFGGDIVPRAATGWGGRGAVRVALDV